ncbi:MAG: transglycosylase SLT domain-containing protein [Phyllobacterium sp.]
MAIRTSRPARNALPVLLLALFLGSAPLSAAEAPGKPVDAEKPISTGPATIGAAIPTGLPKGATTNDKPVLPPKPPVPDIKQICLLIATHADANGLPRDFFARLIWKESRFDHQAVSPVGAEGIAQFMPATARERGLKNSFDIEQALPASARFLKDLRGTFGNWGLAAAAYNAGPNRVSRWLSSGGFLPLETEDYVLSITGRPADDFTTGIEIENRPLDAKLSFEEACQKLPIIQAATVAMARVHQKPWGIQVAGNFRRSAAVKQWQRIKVQFPSVLSQSEPVVSRQRTPIGRRGIYAVRIGADSRNEANTICSRLRSAGGACIVMKNR